MLSFMAKGFFGASNVLVFPLVALFVFLVVFTAMSVRAWRTDKRILESVAALPLSDEDPQGEGLAR